MVEAARLLERRFHPHDRAAPSAAVPSPVAADGDAGDIYLDKYAGWYSVRDEAYYGENEIEDARRAPLSPSRPARRSNGSRRKAISSVSPPIRTACSRIYEATSRFHRPAGAAQRDPELRQGRASGPVGVAHHLRLGHSGSGSAGHIMYVWVDALTNYVRQRDGPMTTRAQPLLAGRSPCHRQGHRALPRRVLAGLSDVGRLAAAEAGVRSRLPVQQGRENVEVGRQRDRTRCAGRRAMASIRFAISSCAKCRSARTATTATKRSSIASMPISPTISAIWRSARCR